MKIVQRAFRILGACVIGLLLFLAVFSFIKPLDYSRLIIPAERTPDPCLGSGPETSVVARQINFHVIDPGVWRSAEPNEESLMRMQNHGLKTVVDFRVWGVEGVENTKQIAEKLKLQYHHFPIIAGEEQDLAKLDAILAVMENPANQPVLIHCRAGKDRTGMMTALYKIKNTDAKFHDIYREMLMFGYDHTGIPNLMKTIRRWCEAHGYSEIAARISLDGTQVTFEENP